MAINFKKVGAGLFAVAATAGAFGLASGALATSAQLTEDLTLTGDVEACYTIPTGATVVVDLADYTITCTGENAFTVEDGAILTVRGGGSVKAMTKGKAAVYNKIGGNVTLNSGNYFADNWYTVKNLGTMTIDGGSFAQNEKMYLNTDGYSNASLIANGWYNSENNGASDQGNVHVGNTLATLTINGGIFNHFSTTSTIKSDDYSKTVIKDGEFNSAKGYLVQVTGDVTIDGGMFDGYYSLLTYNATGAKDYEPGVAVINDATVSARYIADAWSPHAELTVNGGAFMDLEKIYQYDAYKIDKALAGGIYSVRPDGAFVADGFVVAENVDAGTYEVIDPETFAEETGDSVDLYYDEEKGEYEILLPETDLSQLADEFVAETSVPGTVWGTLKFNKSYTGDRRAELHVETHGTSDLVLETGDATKETSLIAAYNVYMQAMRGGSANRVRVTDADITVTLELTEAQYAALSSYDKVEVIYFDDAGKERERFDGRIEELPMVGGTAYSLVFNTTHLSTYGVAGVNVAETDGRGAVGATDATTPDTGAFTMNGGSNVVGGVAAAVAILSVAGVLGFVSYRAYRHHDVRRFK